MPNFRRLTAEQIAALRSRGRPSAVDLTEYTEFLQGLDVGDGGEVTLGNDEKQRTVKRRLTRAATRANKRLRYRRSEGNAIRFEVL